MTGRGRSGIGCTVYASGQRLADGSPMDAPTAPTVLSGLQVDWGRETTVDQPDTSTCTFSAYFLASQGTTFLPRMDVGTEIRVTATGGPAGEVTVWAGRVTDATVAHFGRVTMRFPGDPQGPGETGYFDGDFMDSLWWTYAWAGAAHASTSSATPNAAAPYFDGDTPNTAWWTYAWTGTPHDSTSTATPVAGVELDGQNVEIGLLTVTAADFSSDLQARKVGDDPWPAEPIATRIARILNLANWPMSLAIDPAPAAELVSWQDVDSQPATGLLHDLAQSADAVMWAAARPSGEYLRIEDPTARSSRFALVWTGKQVEIQSYVTANIHEIDACKPLRDPIRFVRDVSDLITRATVSWQEYTPDEAGQPATTERSVTLIDDALEAERGTRGLSVSTLLTNQSDAYAVAERVLARTATMTWRIEGLELDDHLPGVFDTGGDDIDLMLDLLDGAKRGGLPLLLTDLPAWTPSGPRLPVFLEGGQYTYETGAWVLALVVSSAVGLGTSARTWDLEPAWRLWDFDPQIRTLDLRGVTMPSAQEATSA